MSPPLAAQAIEDDTQRLQSVLAIEREGYQPRLIKLGGFVLAPELDIGAIYDSNVYAAHVNEQSDVLTTVRPRLTAEGGEGRFRFRGQLSGELRRYASLHKENSDSYGANATVTARLINGINLSATGGHRRAVENRSDPEVRQNPNAGPPLFDVTNGELAVRGGRGRLGLSIKALMEKYDFVARRDDDRDFTSYRGTARLLYQITPIVNGFVQVYANQRDYRILDPIKRVNRNGRTLGAMAGVQIDPGGKLRGDIGAGFFRYKPVSASFESFSGFALDGSLVYTPRERWAIILDVFQGDVATVRNGASGRIDSRARITLQQEIRHNLISSLALRYRQTRYRGVTDKQTTIGGSLDLEYLIDHHFSIALITQLVKRTSRIPFDRFERARAGLELRARY